MEGNKVYKCEWKKVGRKHFLWLSAARNVSAEYTDFEEASEALLEKVMETYGDGEAVLEFDPPAPTIRGRSGGPEILILGFNEYVEGGTPIPELFEGGLCANCRSGIGQRTQKPLQIEKPPVSDVAAIRNWAPAVRIWSEDFLALLTSEDRHNLQFQEVRFERPARKKYYELTGKSIARFVGAKGATYNPMTCWACPECGAKRIYPRMPPGEMFRYSHFLSVEALPLPSRSCFVCGGSGMPLSLCMTAKRWKRTTGLRGTKGITTIPVAVVSAELADPDPSLPIYKKAQAP